jgi:hypothetical protein
MAFRNLEQRFNETVDDLYRGAKLKFDGGKASTGINDDPLMVRTPGDGRLGIKQEGRSVPFNSGPRDAVRLTLFSASVRGIAFYAKQQLLQTGNTFEQTRLINPVFAIGNAIPFLHLRRHVRPLSTLFTRTDRHYSNVRKLGQLQQGTYNNLSGNAGGVGGFFKKIGGPILSTISAFTAKKNVGEEFGYDETGWKKSRPELGKEAKDYIIGFNAPSYKFGGKIKTENFNGSRFGAIPARIGDWDGTYTTYFSDVLSSNGEKIPSVNRLGIDYKLASILPNNDPNRLFKTTGVSDAVRSDLITKEPLKDRNREVLDRRINTLREDFQRSSDEFITDITGGAISTQPFLKYFIPDNTGVIVSRDGGTNARDLSNDNGRKLKYLKDALNYETDETIETLPRYNRLPSAGAFGDEPVTDDAGNKIDPVLISFAMGNDAHVQFRAFIRDINQSVNPEYKTYQYVGRIEKFISYVSVQREVSFKLDILSFSKDELKVVWNRINYLTSFAFPYEVNKGILQPNVVRFTIGKMYRDQPGYVTSLSTVFNEISESWDIDEEVPIAATINISMAIIEKTTMTANKPFYAINEGNIPVAEIGEVTVISGRDERGFFLPASVETPPNQ